MRAINEKGGAMTPGASSGSSVPAQRFALPDAHPGVAWEVLVDAAADSPRGLPRRLEVGARLALPGRSLQLLRARRA